MALYCRADRVDGAGDHHQIGLVALAAVVFGSSVTA